MDTTFAIIFAICMSSAFYRDAVRRFLAPLNLPTMVVSDFILAMPLFMADVTYCIADFAFWVAAVTTFGTGTFTWIFTYAETLVDCPDYPDCYCASLMPPPYSRYMASARTSEVSP